MLSPGTKLGPYEILAPLGAGGMGEVYRARDTRLGRDVAIKTLPAALAQDPERRARFETEARAIASLSHRNVLALHDIGMEGDIVFAVMELVEGETLRERLSGGPLPVSRALSYAIQIAHGLAAAHDKGVIHRDLKPENIIITTHGEARILDFGLARREAPLPSGSASLAPTEAISTEPGVILGTTGYMSPEQARGATADARSDIFSLGAVIYEMLSGRRAFQADSAADTLSAILREEPPDLAQLVPEVPPAVERIVRRCLEKHPSARFRSAADLAFALEAVSSGSGATKAAGPAAATPSARSVRFRRLTFRLGMVAGARFVPGGSGVVLAAAWEGRPFEVFSSFPGSPEARSLGLPSANVLSISASGEMALSIGYHHTNWNEVRGTLARTSLAGGGVRPLQKDVVHAEWSRDGKAMALVRFMGASYRLEYPAGTVRFETQDWLGHPCVSPDGSHVAFVHHPFRGGTEGDVCVIGPTGPQRVLLPGLTSVSGLAWSPSGEEVWCSGIHEGEQNGIRAVRLDGSVRDLYMSPARVYLKDVAPDGRALLTVGNIRMGMSVSRDDSGHEADLSWFDGSIVSDVSPDGRHVMFWECAEAANPSYASYLRDVDGSPAVRIGEGTSTRFSPDGQWALAMTLESHTNYLWMYPTGLGEPRSIPLEGLERIHWAGFHPDGRRLHVIGSTRDRARRLYIVPIEGGRPDLLWDEPMEFDRVLGPPVSPDGDHFIFRGASGESILFSCRDRSTKQLTDLGADKPLRFDGTGRGLYVSSGHVVDRVIHHLDLETGERRPWRRLAPRDPTGIIFLGDPVMTPDGSTLVYTYYRFLSDLYLVEGLG